jgi:hypothetical protein
MTSFIIDKTVTDYMIDKTMTSSIIDDLPIERADELATGEPADPLGDPRWIAEGQRLLARGERTLAAAALRDEIKVQCPRDLHALGVDIAETRWAAARGYLLEWRRRERERAHHALEHIFFLGRVLGNAKRRGAEPSQIDLDDARRWWRNVFRREPPG